MKKIAVLLLAAGLLFALPAGANAVDFKVKGRWSYNFSYGQNGAFTGGGGRTAAVACRIGRRRGVITCACVLCRYLNGVVAVAVRRRGVGGAVRCGNRYGAARPYIRISFAYAA